MGLTENQSEPPRSGWGHNAGKNDWHLTGNREERAPEARELPSVASVGYVLGRKERIDVGRAGRISLLRQSLR